ncbi:MAG: glycosyltransferase family 2 protein [Candidatus Heimdallarchaeota archaeon]|nr:glycosyltransferase family 2 protein [Candidatus Heimdallarchaeota archaeon]
MFLWSTTSSKLEMRIVCVIPAKDEEMYIEQTLKALTNQTLQPQSIIVIDDNSTDHTSEHASKYTPHVFNSQLEDNSNKISNFKLAQVYNRAFEELDHLSIDFDYILVLDADTILPNNYILDMINYMQENKLDLSSGVIKNEEHFGNIRGSGRIISSKLYHLIGKRYPVNYGFDTYVSAICLVNELKYGVNRNIIYDVQRPTSTNYSYNAYVTMGRAKRAYGYIFLYVLYDFLKLTLKWRDIKIIVGGLFGYCTLKRSSKYPREIRSAFRRYQYRRIIGKKVRA